MTEMPAATQAMLPPSDSPFLTSMIGGAPATAAAAAIVEPGTASEFGIVQVIVALRVKFFYITKVN